MINKVVDTNFLNENELDMFLSQSANHYAVITDYTAIETFKHSDPLSIVRSMKTLSKYPRNIKILKSTTICCGIIEEKNAYPNNLIDKKQSDDFELFTKEILKIETGSSGILDIVKRNNVEAKDQFNRMSKDTNKLLKGLEAEANLYNSEEIQIIRKDEFFQHPLLVSKIIKNSLDFAGQMFSYHSHVSHFPDFGNLPNTFIFRQAICAQVLLLKWIQDGKQKDIKSDKLVNDQIDVNFATFALYFDGLLTKDKKLTYVYENSKILLDLFMEI